MLHEHIFSPIFMFIDCCHCCLATDIIIISSWETGELGNSRAPSVGKSQVSHNTLAKVRPFVPSGDVSPSYGNCGKLFIYLCTWQPQPRLSPDYVLIYKIQVHTRMNAAFSDCH